MISEIQLNYFISKGWFKCKGKAYLRLVIFETSLNFLSCPIFDFFIPYGTWRSSSRFWNQDIFYFAFKIEKHLQTAFLFLMSILAGWECLLSNEISILQGFMRQGSPSTWTGSGFFVWITALEQRVIEVPVPPWNNSLWKY